MQRRRQPAEQAARTRARHIVDLSFTEEYRGQSNDEIVSAEAAKAEPRPMADAIAEDIFYPAGSHEAEFGTGPLGALTLYSQSPTIDLDALERIVRQSTQSWSTWEEEEQRWCFSERPGAPYVYVTVAMQGVAIDGVPEQVSPAIRIEGEWQSLIHLASAMTEAAHDLEGIDHFEVMVTERLGSAWQPVATGSHWPSSSVEGMQQRDDVLTSPEVEMRLRGASGGRGRGPAGAVETPGFLGAFKDVFANYANFTGRTSRGGYWRFAAVNIAILAAFSLLAPVSSLFLVALIAFMLVTVIPATAAVIRRLHDTGRSGWAILLQLIPLVGGVVLLVFLASAGDRASNSYGAPPVQRN